MKSSAMQIDVTRGGALESRHEVIALAVDCAGSRTIAYGDVTTPVFPRSALKPLQALTVVASGAADNLSAEQIALMCASHHGERQHLERVEKWLGNMGLSETDLACGPDWPRNHRDRDSYIGDGGQQTSALYNCSGKHCGQLCYCQHMDWPIEGYHLPDHPAQTSFRTMLADLSGGPETALGIDGCHLPAPQLPLDSFALALARMADASALDETHGAASQRIVESFMTHPELTGGRMAVNSRLTKAGHGHFAAKNGAEGVYGVIVPEMKMGIAVKCMDGAMRAADLAVADILRQLGLIEPGVIEELSLKDVRNSRDVLVGALQIRTH